MKRYLHSGRELRLRATGGWFCGIAIGVMIVIAGCSTTGGALTKDTPPEIKAAAAKERSSARWAALIRGDKDVAYGYLSPGTRSLMTIEQYRGRVQTGGFRAVQIEKVDCEPETCSVGLMLTYDYVAPKGIGSAKGITTYVQETWVLENGQVWLVMRP